MSVDHYENFPVASLLLPLRLRAPVEVIYRFARSADDLADEGERSAQERLDALAEYDRVLDDIASGRPVLSPLFRQLAETISTHRLPIEPFRNLLSAFRQDVVQHRYDTQEQLVDYCRRSANPVGRIMLALYGHDDARNRQESDAICTALQLINFYQDLAIDWRKERIYIPREDLARFAVDERHFAQAATDDNWRALMRYECDAARTLMFMGAPLAKRLPGRIGWELRLSVQGGLRILEKIARTDYDVFNRRPTLGSSDWCVMGMRAIFQR